MITPRPWPSRLGELIPPKRKWMQLDCILSHLVWHTMPLRVASLACNDLLIRFSDYCKLQIKYRDASSKPFKSANRFGNRVAAGQHHRVKARRSWDCQHANNNSTRLSLRVWQSGFGVWTARSLHVRSCCPLLQKPAGISETEKISYRIHEHILEQSSLQGLLAGGHWRVKSW